MEDATLDGFSNRRRLLISKLGSEIILGVK